MAELCVAFPVLPRTLANVLSEHFRPAASTGCCVDAVVCRESTPRTDASKRSDRARHVAVRWAHWHFDRLLNCISKPGPCYSRTFLLRCRDAVPGFFDRTEPKQVVKEFAVEKLKDVGVQEMECARLVSRMSSLEDSLERVQDVLTGRIAAFAQRTAEHFEALKVRLLEAREEGMLQGPQFQVGASGGAVIDLQAVARQQAATTGNAVDIHFRRCWLPQGMLGEVCCLEAYATLCDHGRKTLRHSMGYRWVKPLALRNLGDQLAVLRCRRWRTWRIFAACAVTCSLSASAGFAWKPWRTQGTCWIALLGSYTGGRRRLAQERPSCHRGRVRAQHRQLVVARAIAATAGGWAALTVGLRLCFSFCTFSLALC